MKQLLMFGFIGLMLCAPAHAVTPGQQGFTQVRHCIMENNPGFCRSILTPASLPFFDRFVSYKLMPCLPTDFTYSSEEVQQGHITVKALTPAGNGVVYIVRLVFIPTPAGVKLDLPASFDRGLGHDWQSKIALSEQLYLMMRQNMGDRLTCDMLDNLVKAP